MHTQASLLASKLASRATVPGTEIPHHVPNGKRLFFITPDDGQFRFLLCLVHIHPCV